MKEVAVIGAGPMGLAVAMELRKRGHAVCLFEAADRVGGMSAAFDFGDIRLERYYHFICANDHPHLEMLEEMGLADRVHWKVTRMGLYYGGRLHEWGNPWALLRFPGLGWLAKFRYGLHIFLTTKRRDWRRLDRIEATGWLRRWVGSQAFDVVWHKLFELKFHRYSGHLSAAWIWSRIRRLGTSRYNLFREKLGYLEGGAETLMQAMASWISEHGGQLHLATPVEEIIIESGRVRGLRYGGETRAFDAVVSTVPIPYVPNMLPALPGHILDQYRSVENLAVVCVILKLRRSVSDYFWLNINDESMDIPGVIEYTRLNAMDSHIVYAPYYLPGDHPLLADEDERFAEKVWSYLCEINPELQPSDLIESCVNRYRYSQPVCSPGFLDGLPPVSPGVNGLYVADTCYYYPHDRGVSESIELGQELAGMVDAS